MDLTLSILFGAIVGFSLGLTGGGGSIFAVPLLVYGLAVPPQEAVGISLAAVGATSLVGAIQRWRDGQLELGTGLIFAVAGMVGAPFGSWISTRMAPSLLLLLFAGLMCFVALRMWFNGQGSRSAQRVACDDQVCQRDEGGQLRMSTRCALLLLCIGVATGVLSGLFGVGGGFVIVPALVLFSRMPIHRAVATSLLVIALISASGVTAHYFAGDGLSTRIIGLFIAGGILGLFLGTRMAQYLSARRLQQIFAIAIILVAVFVIAKTTVI